MKRLVPAALLALITAASLSAQKKPLDHSVYDGWESVGQTLVSPSGDVVAFVIQPQEGDGRLVIRTMGKKGREIIVPRGYKPSILDDGSKVVCLVKPEFQKTRKAKIAKKKGKDLPKDSLAVVSLKDGSIVKFPSVSSYKLGAHSLEALAIESTDTAYVKKSLRKKKDMGSPLLVYHFSNGALDTLKNIDGYGVTKDGLWISMVRKTAAKKSVAGFFNTSERKEHFFKDTTSWHGVPVFDEAGTKALYLEATDTVSSGSKHPSLRLVNLASLEPETLLGPGTGKWGITEKCKVGFSHNGERIYAHVNEFVPPKDTSLVSFETPGLDIWNWDAPFTPPTQKKSGKKLFSPIKALYSDGKLIPAAEDHLSKIISTKWEDSDVVLRLVAEDIVSVQWDSQLSYRIEAVKLSTGAVKLLDTARADDTKLSPDGSHAIWWDLERRCWICADTESGDLKNISASIDTKLWEEDDDHPSLPDSYGFAEWVRDGSVLIYDKYDIWKVSIDGSNATRITKGREKGLTYRYVKTRSNELEPGLNADETIFLSMFDHATKENGIASISLARPEKSLRTMAFGGYSWRGLNKARNGNAMVYLKGNFNNPMDLYYVTAPGKKEEKLSAINPDKDSYTWGTVELYKWTAYDGTPLEGLLFRPEDFSESKKYPVIVYFYEKYSDKLYSWFSPGPSASTINIPFFVSRGYVVFVPDIVYHSGIPGESAYNCIVSGAESLKQFPWIDGDNMAIQGQSWGGYQVAYLITRTGMFKAAGAGAPVSNMTSAYGGIRWESGSSRQMQYEMGQSRIGRPLWDGIELYMENSPLFKLPNVTTPVLIMHNDADGAVPWYQGIELFMGLRRLGKPAWLLEYNDEAHNLRQRRNRKDLSIRLQQFFDHYLKGAPEPAWMKYGVPTDKKGYYFGYEDADKE
ncbi:MAG: S9 family peptidase [Bacteroidales bacterium]|nr:S9 family peptidase [Bacteroidales bacterium]